MRLRGASLAQGHACWWYVLRAFAPIASALSSSSAHCASLSTHIFRLHFVLQGLSNSAWAFAKLGFSSPMLFEALAEAAVGKLDAFTPQGLSNTVWAYATVGHYHPFLMQQLADQVLQQVNNFSAINCSNTLWAFASLRHYNPALFESLLERLVGHLDEVEPQNVANALYALARVNHPLAGHTGRATNWFHALVQSLPLLLSCTGASGQWLRACLVASTQPRNTWMMGVGICRRLVKVLPCFCRPAGPLVSAAKRLMPNMNQQELCNTAWALGVLGQLDRDTWEEFCNCVIDTQGAHDLGLTCWQLTGSWSTWSGMLRGRWCALQPAVAATFGRAARRCHHALLRAGTACACQSCMLYMVYNVTAACLDLVQHAECVGACIRSVCTGLTPEGVHQAFHAQLMLHSQIARQAGVPLSALSADQLPTLPEPLAGHARHMWLASAVDVHVSKLQTDVSGALVMAGIPNTIEWLTDDGLFSIDIAFEVSAPVLLLLCDSDLLCFLAEASHTWSGHAHSALQELRLWWCHHEMMCVVHFTNLHHFLSCCVWRAG